MTKIVNRIRIAVAKARLSEPLGRWIPNNKIIAGSLASGLTAGAQAAGLVDLPSDWSIAVAGAVVGYLFPESVVVSARQLKERSDDPIGLRVVDDAE